MRHKPPPYRVRNPLNQSGYNPATYIDGRESSNHHTQNTSYSQTTHRPNETDNLLPNPHNGQRKTSFTPTKLGIFLFLAIALAAGTIFLFYPSTGQIHDDIRRQWEAEEHNHQVMRDAWSSERQAMVVERATWQKERADHNSEREAMAAEREHWRKEKEDHENRGQREEEEQRKLLVWKDLTASTQCLRYGTREYSATLANVARGLDPLKECWNKSIDIHGRQVLPSRCETEGKCGAVRGHWTIDFNEATCVTWWRGYDNKGCVERGIHRYESVLENLQWGDDWHVMCATTPGHPQGKDFNGPTSCASWRSGINGIWLVEDDNCH